MENAEKKDMEQKRAEQLGQGLLGLIGKQLEIKKQLKEMLEPLLGARSKHKAPILDEETIKTITDLFIEDEALQAEERAVFHQLFPIDG